jgi:hypothetical protein
METAEFFKERLLEAESFIHEMEGENAEIRANYNILK